MTRARKNIIAVEDEVATYHVTARCVRRSYLMGKDPYNGKDYSHRKVWIKDRLEYLVTKSFFVENQSYAVMDNHLHLLLRCRPDLARKATDEEIAKRWWYLYPKDAHLSEDGEPPAEVIETWINTPGWVEERRARLSSLSWFMKMFSEYIARRANKEDGVTGRFWEGRFSSQWLQDNSAILAASVYVDLNPVRANVCKNIEDASFTSIRDRIIAKLKGDVGLPGGFLKKLGSLMDGLNEEAPILTIDPDDYIAICAWGAALHIGNTNEERQNLYEKALDRLKIKPDLFVRSMAKIQRRRSIIKSDPKS